MKIKWCHEIFKKPEKSKCFICKDFHFPPIGKKCYGIFYIFHKIAQIRFIVTAIFYRIKNFKNRHFNEHKDDIPF